MITTYLIYSDVSYVARAVSLIQSLRNRGEESNILFFSLDDIAHQIMKELAPKGVQVVTLDKLEGRFEGLAEAKMTRSPMEYVFTLTPFLFLYAMKSSKPEDLLVYLDADLYFLSSPGEILSEVAGSDIGIVPHFYPSNLKKRLQKYGVFNVGWVGIRNSENGRACAEWWGERCLEWCYDTPLDGKYADQGYLNQVPMLFKGVKILENRGFNLAPWNVSGQKISKDGQGRVLVGDQTPVTFFHFHGLKRFGKWMITSQLNYRSPASNELIDLVYKPYLRSLKRAEELVSNHTSSQKAPKLARGRGLRKLARVLLTKVLMVTSVITGNAIDMSRLK